MDPRERLEQLWRDHAGVVLSYAARRTSDGADAADVLAETFTVAWRKLDRVPHGDEARPWLIGVARNELRTQYRRSSRDRRLDDRLASEARTLVARHGREGDTSGETAAMGTAFDRLTDEDRELLTLVGWDGLDPREVAVVLGVQSATVRVRLHRARRRFAAHLDDLGVTRDESRTPLACLDPEDAR